MSAAGAWDIVIKTPMGDNKVQLNLATQGDQLSGSMSDGKDSNDITDGKVDGNTLTWKTKVSKPLPMSLEFTATIEGDKISGGAKSPFGTAPFSGARA